MISGVTLFQMFGTCGWDFDLFHFNTVLKLIEQK
jgi:hypothetical protein